MYMHKCQRPICENCTLTGGEEVPHGWNGNDTGDNSCNTCSCENGVLSCTEKECDPCANKTCGDKCGTSDGMMTVMLYCQKDGSCDSNAEPDCEEDEEEVPLLLSSADGGSPFLFNLGGGGGGARGGCTGGSALKQPLTPV